MTDRNLGLTGDAARQERLRRFREWVANHTVLDRDGDPLLLFDFTTSIEDRGLFNTVIAKGYDRFWLHQMAGVGLPQPRDTGFGINLVTGQLGNLDYQRVAVTQSGVTHLRALDGCILDYRLIHPAALLGFDWPANQPPESMTTDFKARVNPGSGDTSERTSAFLMRPVSATNWQVQVFAGRDNDAFDNMDLQQLFDIQLLFSTTRGHRDPTPCPR